MNPIQQHHLVNDRVARLAAEASAERLARQVREARSLHPDHGIHAVDASPARTGLRVAIGRALIGLGTAIAAGSDEATDASMGQAA